MPDTAAVIETDIPARLDRLPWTRFHTLIVVALGITWILDGLEVTLAGSIAGALQESPVLRFDAAEVGLVGTAYLIGAVTGAVLFGYLTDRFGRRKLFFVTLGLYLTATAATAFSWGFWSFALFRSLTGAGIGGEYTAINSAIQEFIPARFRGRTDLAINGSFWIGAALGAAGAVLFLQPGTLPPDWGWRAAFGGRANSARRDLANADGANGASNRARLSAARRARPRADGLASFFLQCHLLHLRTRSDPIF